VPTAPGVRSTYASVKEKAAFDWPLVSTAVALRPPWRSAWTEAVANAAVASAQPLAENGYKVELLKTLLRRTLRSLAGGDA